MFLLKALSELKYNKKFDIMAVPFITLRYVNNYEKTAIVPGRLK